MSATRRAQIDERLIRLTLERLPEGVYLATSADLPGLVAQGRTLNETMEVARDVARKLIESCIAHGDPLPRTLRKRGRKLDATVAIAIEP